MVNPPWLLARMNLFRYQPWVNLLTLLPGTSLTLLTIAVAFLRFYNEEDFRFLGYLAQPRIWSNRLTVAVLLVAVVNFGVEWNLRNRETNRLAEAEQRRSEAAARAANERAEEINRRTQEEQRRSEEAVRAANERAEEINRRAEERERAARRARVEARCRAAQIRFQLEPSQGNRQSLAAVLAVLEEYGDTL
ncbi:MAG: hypothetical protein LVS60_00005 [Nodosilinea sp. LVE1205-7]